MHVRAIRQSGNGDVIPLPRRLARALGIQRGDHVVIMVTEAGVIQVQKLEAQLTVAEVENFRRREAELLPAERVIHI